MPTAWPAGDSVKRVGAESEHAAIAAKATIQEKHEEDLIGFVDPRAPTTERWNKEVDHGYGRYAPDITSRRFPERAAARPKGGVCAVRRLERQKGSETGIYQGRPKGRRLPSRPTGASENRAQCRRRVVSEYGATVIAIDGPQAQLTLCVTDVLPMP
jgi:hypothetical protein